MTAKEYLSQAFYLKKEVKALQLKIEQIREDTIYSKNTIGYEGRGSAAGDKMSNYVAKIDSLERQIKRRIDKLVSIEHNVLVAINKIDNSLYRQVLINRYLNCLAWGKIAKEMNYSIDNVFRLYGKALIQFDRVLKSVQ